MKWFKPAGTLLASITCFLPAIAVVDSLLDNFSTAIAAVRVTVYVRPRQPASTVIFISSASSNGSVVLSSKA
jgi:hypothetical protein